MWWMIVVGCGPSPEAVMRAVCGAPATCEGCAHEQLDQRLTRTLAHARTLAQDAGLHAVLDELATLDPPARAPRLREVATARGVPQCGLADYLEEEARLLRMQQGR
ncbi:MAG: hypothetical protein KTR31_19445 [Myxococcales bacterium]|nr:hypothetical protein [Myxococcales bacterium]